MRKNFTQARPLRLTCMAGVVAGEDRKDAKLNCPNRLYEGSKWSFKFIIKTLVLRSKNEKHAGRR
jgi:hypothetical protein